MPSTPATPSSAPASRTSSSTPAPSAGDEKNPTDGTLKTCEAGLDRRLDRIMAQAPTHPAGLKLMRIIQKVRRHLFVFVQNRELSATDNGSERAPRPCAVDRKITNAFRSEWGAALYADIRSVVETARRRAVRAFEAIRLTLKGEPVPAPT